MTDQSETSTETIEPSLNGTGPGDRSSIPTTGVEGKPLQPPSWPVIGGLVAAVAAVLWLLRGVGPRRRPPTKTERLSEAGQALGAAAVGLGTRAARRTAAVAEPVARDVATRAVTTAPKAAGVAADAAQNAAGLASGAAQNAAGLASEAAQTAARTAAEAAAKVASAAAEGAHDVAAGVESVQKFWHKLVTRLIIVVFGSIGYVLGARAGRERYDQIAAGARRVRDLVTSG